METQDWLRTVNNKMNVHVMKQQPIKINMKHSKFSKYVIRYMPMEWLMSLVSLSSLDKAVPFTLYVCMHVWQQCPHTPNTVCVCIVKMTITKSRVCKRIISTAGKGSIQLQITSPLLFKLQLVQGYYKHPWVLKASAYVAAQSLLGAGGCGCGV